MSAIHYNIIPSNPQAHLFTVTCTIPDPDPEGQVVSVPAWIPGSYMIRDFAKNIVSIQASCDSADIEMTKLDKQSWRCTPCMGSLTIVTEVYAWDLSVRSAHLDTTHAYFNGPSVFLNIKSHEQTPCQVNILQPAGEAYKTWKVATAMTPDGAALHGFGLYKAENYDELIDHPVEMGNFTLATFSVAGVPHDIAITGKHQADMDRLCRDLTVICEEHVALFGELPPMQRYVFQVMAVGEGYGGLEHRASTSLMCSRDDLPVQGVEEITEAYRTFLGLCSHEYFHTWNIKRIKPAAFVPYNLERESYTHLMWMFEGITSYYDDLALVRTGLISVDSYLELVAQNITRLLRTPGRLKQTVWDSSYYAWNKFYQQNENSPNAIVSYYGKGALIALGLDLYIREHSKKGDSLDTVMRYLWEHYGKKGIGVPDEGIETELADMLELDLSDFFDRSLRSVEELPLQTWLEEIGINYHLYPPTSDQDKGGKLPDKATQKISLGVRTVENPSGALVTHVLEGSAAQQAGMSAGDIIIAVDGLRAHKKNLEKLLGAYHEGDRLQIHVFRRDELMTFDVSGMWAFADTVALSVSNKVPEWLKKTSA